MKLKDAIIMWVCGALFGAGVMTIYFAFMINRISFWNATVTAISG